MPRVNLRRHRVLNHGICREWWVEFHCRSLYTASGKPDPKSRSCRSRKREFILRCTLATLRCRLQPGKVVRL